jgi:hypothetical protein
MTAIMHGIPVHLSPVLPDGQVFMSSDYADPFGNEQSILWIGSAPLTELAAARREARLAVRRGLADVLAWLGETVENEPTGVELWNALTREGNR